MENDDYDESGDYEEEGDDKVEEEGESFGVSHFIDPDEGEGRDEDSFPDEEATASGKVEEEEIDPDELEETFKRLEEVFCCLPRVLIERILCRDDVKGNIEIASQRLQEFQDMDDPQDMFKAPMKTKPPVAQQPPENGGDFEVDIETAEAEPERFQERQKGRNNNEPQGKQMEIEEESQWRTKSFDRNEAELKHGNQVYSDQESRKGGSFKTNQRGGERRGCRGGPSGGQRDGFSQSQRNDQEYKDDFFQNDLRFGYQHDNFVPRPQRGRGVVIDRGHPPDTRPIPRGRPRLESGEGPRGRPRGGFLQGQGECGYDLYQQAWDNGQEYRDDFFEDDWRFGYHDVNFMPHPQRGRGNVNYRGHPPDTRRILRGRLHLATGEEPRGRARGGFLRGQGKYGYDLYQQAWDNGQEYGDDFFEDDWRFGYHDVNFMPHPQRRSGNVNDRGRSPDTIPRGRTQRATGDEPRGMPRGGFVQDQEEYGYDLCQQVWDNDQDYGDDVFQDSWRPQPQRERWNVNDRGRPPDTRPIARGRTQRVIEEGPRGRARGGTFQSQGEYGYDRYKQAWHNKDQGYRRRVNDFQREDGFEGRRQWGQSSRQPEFAQDKRLPSQGRDKDPVYLIDMEENSKTYRSYDDDLGHSEEYPSYDRDQVNPVGPCRAGNRERGCSGMSRAQRMSGVAIDGGVDVRENEADESRFEQYKLVVCGLSEMTTDESVWNFIEAMSGEEVMEVSRLGKSKALVTMCDLIKDFPKIKRKGEGRGLDSAQVSIERVSICTSILVTGISNNATHDAIELYFESQRNSGGPVSKVQLHPNSGRAVVVFQDPRDMEKVLARQQERPHVLNNEKLSLRTYHESLEDDYKDDSDSAAAAIDSANKEPVTQRSQLNAHQLHMAVNPDVMEYVTSTSHHDQLKEALEAKKSEINWKPNNKMAVIVYRGEGKGDSWQSECIEEVQNYLGKFTTRDVKVNNDFWEAVKTQLCNIRACLGVDPPLVKPIDEAFVLKVVSLNSDAEKFETQLNTKLEELYCEETRKTYLNQTKKVAEERLILLKKIKFAEKLQENNKELEIKLDTEAEEIYFEGPQPQFIEATMKFHKLDMDMVEKKLSVSKSILEVLGSDEALQRVKCGLEENNVEAVFVIDNEARIVGTSAAQVDKAANLVSNLTLEEKVHVDDKSQHLLKTAEWRQLCDELNQGEVMRVYRNNWSATFVAGFREEVTEAMKMLNAYLENNCIQTERFTCPSKLVRRYLSELRQDDLRSIETQFADFEVKIQNGRGDEDLVISGNKEGLKHSRTMLSALLDGTDSRMFDVKQPGLRKYFTSGKADHLLKSVEKDHACAILVERSFDKKQKGMPTRDVGTAAESDATSGDDDDEHYADRCDSDDDEQEEEAVEYGTNPTFMVTTNGHKISWRAGYIETERADILVSSQGACSKAIISAGGQALRQSFANPNTGDIKVTPGSGSLACNHVIHTSCCKWDRGNGETVLRSIVQMCLQKGEELGGTSIAFPVIGAGNLNFPLKEASRIMLDEAIGFCQANPSSIVKDIRFVVYKKDQALITAIGQEMASLKSQHKLRPGHTLSGFFPNVTSFRQNPLPNQAGRLSIEALQGNLCLETTDAIVNINSKDMNMESAGKLSIAVKQASGVQDECTRLGRQAGGSVVMTSSGYLAARGVRHIIHLIPESADKNHLQQCVEKCLRLAESRGIQSISFPAIGTGVYGMSAADSASLIFQALSNFSANLNTIRKVRIVIFQAQMLPAFQQEQQRHSLLSNQGVVRTRISKTTGLSIEVIKGDLTKETTDAIMNINSTDMDMKKAGDLSKAILSAGGAQVQQECSQLGKQTPGSAVMTSGGSLAAPRIIHIIPGSAGKQHLKTCLEAGLRLADTNNLGSVSIPSVGTGGYGLAAADSAQLTFEALNNFSGNCRSVRKVRVVLFQASMMQEFLQAQQRQAIMQDVEERGRDSPSHKAPSRQPRKRRSGVSVASDHSVKIFVTGKDRESVEKVVDSLKKGFSEACATQKVENDTICQLSQNQIDNLAKKAKYRDISLEIEADSIVVRGELTEMMGMVNQIWVEINKRNKKIQEQQQALLVSKNIEWSYEIHGTKMVFGPKTNAKIEMAHSKEQATVRVCLRADEFVVDLKAKTGRGRRNGETITLCRKLKGAEEGIPLPKDWAPMPRADMTVHKVTLAPGSSEYQTVMRKVQATAGGMNIQRIERIQNPHLYQSYMVRKHKMDKDNGGNNERQLFHGTDAKNITAINTQGFNRSFCGVHGVACGRGVYFARDASYSVGYAGGGGGTRYMYLARVLVGQYCQGNSSMIVPPPKNPSRPEILYESVVDDPRNPNMFVVFYDTQCYPEYLITF